MAKSPSKKLDQMHATAHASNKRKRNEVHAAGKKQPVFDPSEWNAIPDAKA